MKEEKLCEIEQRAEKATQGPWETDAHYPPNNVYCDDSTGSIIAECPVCGVLRNPLNTKNNADFIAHARQDIPDLLAYCRELKTEDTRLRKVLLTKSAIIAELQMAYIEKDMKKLAELSNWRYEEEKP